MTDEGVTWDLESTWLTGVGVSFESPPQPGRKHIVRVRQMSMAWNRVYFFITNLLYDQYRPQATCIEVSRNWKRTIASNITIKKVIIT
jgi:hypothetical protein